MKVLMYNIDEGGLKTYAQYLVKGMKKNHLKVKFSDKLDIRGYDIVHVQFDYSLFQPFGMRVIPLLVWLKMNGKKVVLTFGVVPKKKGGIYARNRLFTEIKKIILPLVTKIMSLFVDKFVVMLPELKTILMRDYGIKESKIEVIAHGMY